MFKSQVSKKDCKELQAKTYPGSPVILDCCDTDNCNARGDTCNLTLLMNQFNLCEKMADAIYNAPKDKMKSIMDKKLPPCKALNIVDKFCKIAHMISSADSKGKLGGFMEAIIKACDFRADFTCGKIIDKLWTEMENNTQIDEKFAEIKSSQCETDMLD